jgi:2-keto-4-pentenoate hydratase
MNEADVAQLAGELAAARRTREVVPPAALEPLKDFDSAYRLQDAVRDELGAIVTGWKVAAAPSGEVIAAPLFKHCLLSSGDLLTTPALARDGVESELALRIDRPLPAGDCTRDDVIAAVGAVMPAFELLCSRLPGKFASPREHIVADGMGNGAVVLGAPCSDWRALKLDELRAKLRCGEALLVDKRGGNPFGDPLLAVVLLARHLAKRGQAVEVGTFVLAGSHTGVHLAQPGDGLRCDFEGIGHVELTLHGAVSTIRGESDAGR